MADQERGPGYPPTPELDKLSEARERLGTQAIGEFLDWLREQGIVLALYHEHNVGCYEQGEQYPDCGHRSGQLVVHTEPLITMLERYAEVDPMKMDQERRAIIDWMRAKREKEKRDG